MIAKWNYNIDAEVLLIVRHGETWYASMAFYCFINCAFESLFYSSALYFRPLTVPLWHSKNNIFYLSRNHDSCLLTALKVWGIQKKGLQQVRWSRKFSIFGRRKLFICELFVYPKSIYFRCRERWQGYWRRLERYR